MKDTTVLAKVVAEALVLGVYPGESANDLRVILFLARAEHGSWTVNGRYHSVGDGMARHVQMSREALRTVLKRLVKAGVVTSIRLGYATTYALTTDFLTRCQTLWDLRWDLDAVESYHNAQGLVRPRTRVYLDPAQGLVEPQHKRAQRKSTGMSATADAAPSPDGEGGEDHMTDYPQDFYGPKKGKREYESPALGEDRDKPLAQPKAIKSPYPTTGPVARMREQFREMFQAESERKHVPLWGKASKMNGNLRWLLERPDVTEEVLASAFRFFVAVIPGMAFDGTSLWDAFFVQREDMLRNAVVSSYGSRGGPREDADDLAARMQAKALRRMGVHDGD